MCPSVSITADLSRSTVSIGVLQVSLHPSTAARVATRRSWRTSISLSISAMAAACYKSRRSRTAGRTCGLDSGAATSGTKLAAKTDLPMRTLAPQLVRPSALKTTVSLVFPLCVDAVTLLVWLILGGSRFRRNGPSSLGGVYRVAPPLPCATLIVLRLNKEALSGFFKGATLLAIFRNVFFNGSQSPV